MQIKLARIQGLAPSQGLAPKQAKRNVSVRFKSEQPAGLSGSGLLAGETQPTAVQTLHVPPSAWKGYHGAVFDLASQGVDLAWQTSDLPATHKFIAASYQLLTSRLPLNVLQELLRFTQDPTAPCALLITGLPADSDVPATPTGRKGVKQNENMDIRVPVMESVILGTAKLLGNPMMAASIAKGNRGGLVSDLVGVTEVTYTHKVPMKPHVEFGMGPARPDCILFLGVRQDPADTCRTLICDNRALVAALSPEDVALLRQHELRCGMAGGGPSLTWTVIQGPDDAPVVTLFDPVIIPKLTITGPNEEVTAAYERALHKADEIAERVAVRPGELLIVNQWRCNKGRSAHSLGGDGHDWWLLKTYASQALYKGARNMSALLEWPQVVVPGI